MITVDVCITNNSVLEKVVITGHGNWSDKGSDIVCASVSTLAYTIYLSLQNLPGVVLEFSDDGDDYKLVVRTVPDNVIGELRGITIFFITGIKVLARDYSNNVILQFTRN